MGKSKAINNDQNLIWIITDNYRRLHTGNDFLNQDVKEIMTKSPITVKSDSLAAEAIEVMNDKSITSLFVVDDKNKTQGIIHIHDYLKFGTV